MEGCSLMYRDIVTFIREMYGTDEFLPLHEPKFFGNEQRYVNETIESTFVSSLGKFIPIFEEQVAAYVGAKYAVATSNGTSALHVALKLLGVDKESEVITQPLTFIATANAISYCGASPIFIDVDRKSMGLSAEKLEEFLSESTYINDDGSCINSTTKKVIRAVVPMHTFGHPSQIEEIVSVCDRYNIKVVEDSAESLGSRYRDKHTGTFGELGIFSFNGNKIITSGGGGMIVTDNEALAKRAKHITTTAKVPHPYEYMHDEIAYNYRLSNLNAALGVAQMENLDLLVTKQRELASNYEQFFKNHQVSFVTEPKEAYSNYWLNAIILEDREAREAFLKYSNESGIMTRPIWRLMNKLKMFEGAQKGDLSNALWLEDRVVNISSSVIL